MNKQESILKFEPHSIFYYLRYKQNAFFRQKTRLSDKQEKEKKKKERKKRTYRILLFAIPVDHRVKIKDSEKRN